MPRHWFSLPPSWRPLALFAAVFLLMEGAVVSAEPRKLSVAEARVDANGDAVPDLSGEKVVLQGVATMEAMPFGPGALSFLQDETAGIALFCEKLPMLIGQFGEGDVLRVSGRLSSFAGTDLVAVDMVEKIGAKRPLAVRDVLAADLLSKRYFGQLVKVYGKLDTHVSTNNLRTLTLTDRSGSIPIYIPDIFFADTTFLQKAVRNGDVEITGMASIYCPKKPYNRGYLLMPRRQADFRFMPVPPYKEIAGGVTVAGLAGLAVYLNASRRRVREQAQETARLLADKQRSETALLKAKQDFTALVNSIEGIVWEADAKTFRFTFVSKEAERLLGYSISDWLNQPEFFKEHVYKEDLGRVLEAATNAVKSRSSHEIEYRMVSAQGELLWLRDLVTVIVEDAEATKVRGIMLDITARKKLEAQLLQSQKMQSLGQLAGGVAHDFNNILTVIQGHAGLLKAKPDTSEQARAALEEICESADRAANLTRQLLLFSRQQVARLRPLDLNEVARHATEMLQRLLGETIAIRVDFLKTLPCINADATMVEQVLMNLAINARDAMPNGGTLKLETFSRSFGSEAKDRNPEANPGLFAGLRVSDTGAGIHPSVLPHIFEPFYTTKEVGKGTGLGLSTVYGIVKQHKGWIQVESGPGKGTSFDIFFPCLTQEKAILHTKPSPRDVKGCGTILLVEDEAPVRSLAKSILTNYGYDVLEAPSGADAWAIWQTQKPAIKLLLTDIVMPGGIGGDDLANRMAAEDPNLKILLCSGYSSEMHTESNEERGRFRFIQKPYTSQELGEAVRECLDS